MLSLNRTTTPSEPLTTAEIKTHLSIASAETGYDSYLDDLVKVAREHVETQLNRQLVTATWVWKLDQFPTGNDCLMLPVAPAISVTSIGYVDTAGDSQTFSDYTLSADYEPGLVRPNYGKVWPATRQQPDAITITFTAGFGDVGDVPSYYKHLIRFLVAHWFNAREPVVVGTITQRVPVTFDDMLNGGRWASDFLKYAGR